MDDLQPGFDVESVDPASGRCRRIEVKGKEGVFQEDASVALSARQFRDAVAAVGSDIEYWLYVVDRTTTDEPRVYPIPWTRYLDQLKYGFYAHAWLDAVDRAERVNPRPNAPHRKYSPARSPASLRNGTLSTIAEDGAGNQTSSPARFDERIGAVTTGHGELLELWAAEEDSSLPPRLADQARACLGAFGLPHPGEELASLRTLH